MLRFCDKLQNRQGTRRTLLTAWEYEQVRQTERLNREDKLRAIETTSELNRRAIDKGDRSIEEYLEGKSEEARHAYYRGVIDATKDHIEANRKEKNRDKSAEKKHVLPRGGKRTLIGLTQTQIRSIQLIELGRGIEEPIGGRTGRHQGHKTGVNSSPHKEKIQEEKRVEEEQKEPTTEDLRTWLELGIAKFENLPTATAGTILANKTGIPQYRGPGQNIGWTEA